MNFLNPFDLLEINVIDSEAIKKAKRRKLADIELNDGFLEIDNRKISRSEFIKIVDELDDNNKKKMYFFLKKDVYLNKFLLNSDIGFFYLYQFHEIYQNQDFINFVSPYFAESFNQLLVKVFNTGKSEYISKLFSVPILVNQEYTDILYKNLSKLLNDELEKLKNISLDDESINNIEANYQSIVNIELLNSLPDYFQTQRNDIAMELRNFSVKVYNNFGKLPIVFNIIFYALKINVDGFTKIQLKEVSEKLNEFSEQEKQDKIDKLIFEKWIKVSLEIKAIIKNVESKNIQVDNILSEIQRLFSINDLNELPNSFSEINLQIALLLHSLSVNIYNTFGDTILALEIIKHAQHIYLDKDTYKNLLDAYDQLQEIIQKEKQREESLKFSINIRSDIVIISNDKITYKNITLVTKEIDKIKYGIYIQTINGISSSYYTIWYGDKKGNAIEIECNRFLNRISTVKNQYEQILDVSYNIIIPIILQDIENKFNQRKSIKIGDCELNKEGVYYTIGVLFWKRNQFLKWQDITFSYNNGVLSAIDKQTTKVIGSFSFRDTWNAVIFRLIKEYVIGIKD